MIDRQEEFLKKAKVIWGDFFDFSKVKYVNSKTPVEIIHEGVSYMQRPDHIIEKRLPYELSDKHRYSTEEWKNKLYQKFPNFEYEIPKETKYTSAFDKNIKLICHKKDKEGKEHGEFLISSNALFSGNGCGCPKCKGEKLHNSFAFTKDEFIKNAREIWGDKYDYSKVNYYNNSIPVEVICHKIGSDGKEHGSFFVAPGNHISKTEGCPICSHAGTSKSETDLFNEISKYDNSFTMHEKKVLNGYEIDIYSEKYKIGIEYDGLRWHNELFTENNYHLNKTELCKENGVRLIHVFEDEWINKREIVLSRILSIIGIYKERIMGRKCKLSIITSKEVKEFTCKNHLQGYVPSSINIGLNDEKGNLVSVMTFGGKRISNGSKSNQGEYEMIRYCSKIGVQVIGGAEKMLKYFIKEYKPLSIISYCDRRWSNGDLYEKLGFKLNNVSAPSYYYVIGKERKNRFSLRKDILVKKYGCPNDMTEREFCKSQKWYRIYDCGCLCYLMKSLKN
jgi:very-short-patch-repair endonuclease